MKYKNIYIKIKNNYRNLGIVDKLIVWSRFKITPIDEMLEFVPQNGRLLDLGCGFGVFSYFLAFSRPSLKITAIDPSQKRIKTANDVNFRPDNLEFKVSETEEEKNIYDSIIIVDVVYLVDFDRQAAMFKLCFDTLKNGGVLIIKTMNRERKGRLFFLFFVGSLLKFISRALNFIFFFSPKIKGFFGKTLGDRKGDLYYSSPEELKSRLEEAGFDVSIRDIMPRFSPFPSLLCVCRKR